MKTVLNMPGLALVIISLYFAVKSDIKEKIIPDECSLIICIAAVGFGGFSLQRLSFALALMLALGLVLGFGDAKLLGSLSLILGKSIFFVIACAFMLSFIYCVCALLGPFINNKKGERLSLHDSIAFAPFIFPASLGLMISICFS